MRLIIPTIIGLALSAALAQAVELTPADYSPVEGASIRTIRLEKVDRHSRRVVVGVSNKTDEAFNANYDCTFVDERGTAFDSVGGSIQAVPPGQEAISKSSDFADDPYKVVCRIEFTVPAG